MGDSGIFFSTGDWRRRDREKGKKTGGKWEKQRMKKEKPEHDCRAKALPMER